MGPFCPCVLDTLMFAYSDMALLKELKAVWPPTAIVQFLRFEQKVGLPFQRVVDRVQKFRCFLALVIDNKNPGRNEPGKVKVPCDLIPFYLHLMMLNRRLHVFARSLPRVSHQNSVHRPWSFVRQYAAATANKPQSVKTKPIPTPQVV